jgi:hypothetical protein
MSDILIPFGPFPSFDMNGRPVSVTFNLLSDSSLEVKVEVDDGSIFVGTDVKVKWDPTTLAKLVTAFTSGAFPIIVDITLPDLRFKVGDVVDVNLTLKEKPGGPVVPPPIEPSDLVVGNRITLVPSMHPNAIIRHFAWQMKLTGNNGTDVTRSDATFIVRAALSRTPGAVSFESVNNPNWYIRHSLFWLNISLKAADKVFMEDASFIHEKGLSGEDKTFSFKSVNYPGRYVNHAPDNRLGIHTRPEIDVKRASFFVRKGLK